MKTIFLCVGRILHYILKVCMLMTIVFTLVGFVYGSIYALFSDNHTIYSNPITLSFLFLFINIRFNIIVFIILFYYRFNKDEIISESFLYSIFSLVIDNYLGDYYPVNLFGLVILMTFIMIFYILIKQNISQKTIVDYGWIIRTIINIRQNKKLKRKKIRNTIKIILIGGFAALFVYFLFIPFNQQKMELNKSENQFIDSTNQNMNRLDHGVGSANH